MQCLKAHSPTLFNTYLLNFYCKEETQWRKQIKPLSSQRVSSSGTVGNAVGNDRHYGTHQAGRGTEQSLEWLVLGNDDAINQDQRTAWFLWTELLVRHSVENSVNRRT